jgi:hypothetical protein
MGTTQVIAIAVAKPIRDGLNIGFGPFRIRKEQCNRLSIRKPLKGKKVNTRIAQHAQQSDEQMTNDEQEAARCDQG